MKTGSNCDLVALATVTFAELEFAAAEGLRRRCHHLRLPQRRRWHHIPDDDEQLVTGLGHGHGHSKRTCIEDNEVIHDAVPWLVSARLRNLDVAELRKRVHDTIPR